MPSLQRAWEICTKRQVRELNSETPTVSKQHPLETGRSMRGQCDLIRGRGIHKTKFDKVQADSEWTCQKTSQKKEKK
jgi:hypothetical protein